MSVSIMVPPCLMSSKSTQYESEIKYLKLVDGDLGEAKNGPESEKEVKAKAHALAKRHWHLKNAEK